MTTYQLLQLLPERRDAGSGVDELLAEIDATSFEHNQRTFMSIGDRLDDFQACFTERAFFAHQVILQRVAGLTRSFRAQLRLKQHMIKKALESMGMPPRFIHREADSVEIEMRVRYGHSITKMGGTFFDVV